MQGINFRNERNVLNRKGFSIVWIADAIRFYSRMKKELPYVTDTYCTDYLSICTWLCALTTKFLATLDSLTTNPMEVGIDGFYTTFFLFILKHPLTKFNMKTTLHFGWQNVNYTERHLTCFEMHAVTNVGGRTVYSWLVTLLTTNSNKINYLFNIRTNYLTTIRTCVLFRQWKL